MRYYIVRVINKRIQRLDCYTSLVDAISNLPDFRLAYNDNTIDIQLIVE
jgi:hypothetical protein